MSIKVRWTPDALKSFHQNIEYLQQIWPAKVEDEFVGRVEEVLNRIKVNPYLFPIHRPSDKIHKCVINPEL